MSNCVQQVKQMERECLFTIQPAAVLLSKQTQNKLTWAKSGQLSSSEEVWSSSLFFIFSEEISEKSVMVIELQPKVGEGVVPGGSQF